MIREKWVSDLIYALHCLQKKLDCLGNEINK